MKTKNFVATGLILSEIVSTAFINAQQRKSGLTPGIQNHIKRRHYETR